MEGLFAISARARAGAVGLAFTEQKVAGHPLSFDDFPRNLAAIETIARGIDRGFPATVFGPCFGVEQATKDLREGRVLDDISGSRDFAVGHVDRGARGPLFAKLSPVGPDRCQPDQSRPGDTPFSRRTRTGTA